MQSKNVDEMSDYIIDEMCGYFHNKVKDFVVNNLFDDESHRSFSIEFNAYDYFPVIFNYDMGRMGYNICFGITKRVRIAYSRQVFTSKRLVII